jgi:hypothetical protein
MKGLEEAKAGLKALMTPENADAIAGIVAHIDEAEKEHTNLQEQHQGLKDKYVGIVSNMTFPEKPKDDVGGEQKSLDDIIKDNLDKVIANRK